MDALERIKEDLVIANRILAREDVVDAYGHISARNPLNPDTFFLSCSRSPELVEFSDIMEFTLDGKPVGDDRRHPYLERFIHSGIYEARQDVHSVIHSHAEDVLPFTIVKNDLPAVIHSASCMGHHTSRWDIRDKFDVTNMLVMNTEHGRDLARSLGPDRVVLMRGHGFTAAGRSIMDVIRIGVYLPRNARVLTSAMRLGDITPLSAGEIDARSNLFNPDRMEMWRAWEYWAQRAGCANLLGLPPNQEKKS